MNVVNKIMHCVDGADDATGNGHCWGNMVLCESELFADDDHEHQQR